MYSDKKIEGKNILFLTWDGADTNYLEGLFLPIFAALSKNQHKQVHIIQFSWAADSKISKLNQLCVSENIKYTHLKIFRKPIASIASFATLFYYRSFVKKYIKEHQIEALMPRSTMPGLLTLLLGAKPCQIIFDADGLPLEERVEFSGWSSNSLQYRLLSKIEKKIIAISDRVLVRSPFAIAHHCKNNENLDASKFEVIVNGRSTNFFKPSLHESACLKKELNIVDRKIMLYSGSIGPKYNLSEMINLFLKFKRHHSNALFLILTQDVQAAKEILIALDSKDYIIKTIPFENMPTYLEMADVAVGLIQETKSMKAAAAIKYGEYLLMGLPVVLSPQIGPILEFAANKDYIYKFGADSRSVDEFFMQFPNFSKSHIRAEAISYFDLELTFIQYQNLLN